MDDERVRSLYRNPPEGFVAARDALVRALKDEGKPEDATDVKRLRKPTVPAWAVNQLAELDAAGIENLIDAGSAVRAAQQAAMSSGSGAERLRTATSTRRELVGRLARAAAEALRAADRTPEPHLEEIRATLEAASVDGAAAERLRAGTLDRAISEPGGFGDVFGLQLVATEGPDAARSAGRPPAEPAVDPAKLRRDAAAAGRTARQARTRADRLASQLQDLSDRLDELTAKHAEAESAALEAELAERRAEDALRSASERPT